MKRCGKQLTARRQPICGEMYGGTYRFCDSCFKQNEKLYPQGWSAYPGDVCRHGVYTGGCGVDYMCGQCEDGVA